MFNKSSILIKSLFLVTILFGNQSYAHITISFQAEVNYDGEPISVSEPTHKKCVYEVSELEMLARSLGILFSVEGQCKANVHSHEGIPSKPQPQPQLKIPWIDVCLQCPPFLLDLEHNIMVMEQLEQLVNPAPLDKLKDEYGINFYNEEILVLQQQYNLEGYAKELYGLQQQYNLKGYAKKLYGLQQNIDQNGFKNK